MTMTFHWWSGWFGRKLKRTRCMRFTRFTHHVATANDPSVLDVLQLFQLQASRPRVATVLINRTVQRYLNRHICDHTLLPILMANVGLSWTPLLSNGFNHDALGVSAP